MVLLSHCAVAYTGSNTVISREALEETGVYRVKKAGQRVGLEHI